MKKAHLIRLLLYSLLIIFIFIPNKGHCAGPYKTLESISNAIDEANGDTFTQLVDLDALLDQSLNVFLTEAQKPENAQNMPPIVALMFSQAADSGQKGQAIRTLLHNEAKSFVMNGINSGAFAGKKLNNVQIGGMLAPLFANASIGRKEIRGVGDAIKDGDDYLLPFTIYDYGNEQNYPIIGRFSQKGDGLRLTGIDNLEQLFTQIKKEAFEEEN